QLLEHVGGLDLWRGLSPNLDRPARRGEHGPEQERPGSRSRDDTAEMMANRPNEDSRGRHSRVTLLTRARRACGNTDARTTAQGRAGPRAAGRDPQYADSMSRILQETAKNSISRTSRWPCRR